MGLKNYSKISSTKTGYSIIINNVTDLLPKAHRGIFYVSQDNYVFVHYDGFNALNLYADSATSCIIIIVKGKDSAGKNLIGISHLSRTARFECFFAMIERVFGSEMILYASGANPAEPIMTDSGYDYTALRNTDNLREFISKHAYNPDNIGNEPPSPKIVGNMIRLGLGNPSIYTNNLDCFGVNLLDGSMSCDRQWLADAERDATGGLQTLFCIYGPQDEVRPQTRDFTDSEISMMVKAAKENDFDKAADMTDEQILSKYSSTPQFEVPWFCDNIRTAAGYVKQNANFSS